MNPSANPTPLVTSLDAKARSRARLTILFTAFLDVLGFSIIIPQLAVYAAQFGATPLLTGMLASVYSLMGFVFTPVWGRLSDRHGRRPILLISIFGTIIGHLLFAVAASLPFLFFARTIDGITGGNISTAQAYLSDITEPEERARNYGLFGAVFGVAFAIGPLIGYLLTFLPGAWGGNLGLGVVSAFLSLLNFAMAAKFLPETLPESAQKANRESSAGLKGGLFSPGSYAAALRMPRLNTIILVGFLATTAFATLQGTYALYVIKEFVRPRVQSEIRADPAAAIERARRLKQAEASDAPRPEVLAGEGAVHPPNPNESDDLTKPYPRELGGDFTLQNQPSPQGLSWRHVEKLLVRPESAQLVGQIFALIGLMSLVVQGGLIRPLQKRFGEVPLVVCGTFLMAIALALIAIPLGVWWQFATAALLTLGNGLATPVLTSLISQLAPESERGEVLGVFQSSQSLGRIIGPNLGGFLFGAVASGAPYVVGGAIMLAAFFLTLPLRGAKLHSEQPSPSVETSE